MLPKEDRGRAHIRCILAEAVMLGQSISMVLPKVVGFKLTGKLPPTTTATDLVLTIT